MSYDVDIIIDVGDEKPFILDSFNYTYNVWLMFRIAFNNNEFDLNYLKNHKREIRPHKLGLYKLNGLSCIEATPVLIKAIKYMYT